MDVTGELQTTQDTVVSGEVSDIESLQTPSRLSRREFSSLFQTKSASAPYVLHDYSFSEGRLLRPGSDEGHDDVEVCHLEGGRGNPELATNRIVSLRHTSQLWNSAFSEHKQLFPDCQGYLEWDTEAEVQRGLAWEERLKCLTCKYVSPRQKLYSEVETAADARGRRAPAINRSVIVGLSHTGIGYDGMKNILITMNVPPPSLSCLQRNANIVGDQLIQLNRDDMRDIRGKLSRLAHSVGKETIGIEGDCRYNNSLHSGGGKTLFQPATQATYTMCENFTTEKKIISVTNANKLCRSASVLRGKGESVECPKHSGVCTANISPSHVIGDEKQWADNCLTEMANDKIPLKFDAFTSDGDSRAFMAVSAKHPNAEQYRDPNHLAKGQRRALINTKFRKGFFKNLGKGQSVDHIQRRLASEIAYRCTAELNQLVSLSEMDTNKIISGSSYLKDAVLHCMLGDHRHCRKRSFVCSGKKSDSWRRHFLPQSIDLDPSTEDIEKLKAVIDYRLSRSAVLSVKANKNTQKSEAVNRTYTRVNPKHITFSKNFEPRCHSGAHLVNNGLAKSTIAKCESAKAKLVSGSKIIKRLVADTEAIRLRRKKGQTETYKRQRAMRRRKAYNAYDACKAQKAVTYSKNKFDNISRETRKKANKKDHCYAKLK